MGIDLGGWGMSSKTGSGLCQVLAAWLEEHRPAGAVGSILPGSGTEARERPEIVVLCEEGERPHPRLRRYDVTLRGEWRPKEETTPGEFAAGFAAVGELLTAPESFKGLRKRLLPEGMVLKKVIAGIDAEMPEDETARRIEMPVALWVQEG